MFRAVTATIWHRRKDKTELLNDTWCFGIGRSLSVPPKGLFFVLAGSAAAFVCRMFWLHFG